MTTNADSSPETCRSASQRLFVLICLASAVTGACKTEGQKSTTETEPRAVPETPRVASSDQDLRSDLHHGWTHKNGDVVRFGSKKIASTELEEMTIILAPEDLCQAVLGADVRRIEPRRLLLSLVGTLTAEHAVCLAKLAGPDIYINLCDGESSCDLQRTADVLVESPAAPSIRGVAVVLVAERKWPTGLERLPNVEAVAVLSDSKPPGMRGVASLCASRKPKHVEVLVVGASPPPTPCVEHAELFVGGFLEFEQLPRQCKLKRLRVEMVDYRESFKDFERSPDLPLKKARQMVEDRCPDLVEFVMGAESP